MLEKNPMSSFHFSQKDTGPLFLEETREGGELPPKVEALISLIFENCPELKGVSVSTFVPKDEFDGGGYYEFVEGEEGEPVPTIFISQGAADLLEPLLETRKYSVELNARLLGIDPRDMDCELLQLFIVAHEMGHIRDYVVNFKSDSDLVGWEAVDEMNYQRDEVLATLPVGNLSPTSLVRELSGMTNLSEAVAKFPDLAKHPEFARMATLDDLIRIQELEYRTSPPESYADAFAARFIQEHAEKLGLGSVRTNSGH